MEKRGDEMREEELLRISTSRQASGIVRRQTDRQAIGRLQIGFK